MSDRNDDEAHNSNRNRNDNRDRVVVPFGKHRGRTYRWVYENESGYAEWAASQLNPSPMLRDFANYIRMQWRNEHERAAEEEEAAQEEEEDAEPETVDWRDTLFYWSGSLQVKKDGDHHNNDDTRLRIIWTGKQVTLPNCPDARCGPTPTDTAFRGSNSTFSVEGSVDRNNQTGASIWGDSGILEVSITQGSGSDHAGERQNNSNNNKRRRNNKVIDTTRTLLFDTGSRSGLVVGKGRNEYGCFVEVGFTGEGEYEYIFGARDRAPKKMLLVRRYLSDSDERAHWSLTTLKSQVLLDIPPVLVEEGPWNRIMDFVGVRHTEKTRDHPWRSLALCSEPWRQLILRDDQGGFLRKASAAAATTYHTDEPGQQPRLLMSTPGGGPFRLRLSRINFAPNTMWKGQCWGCGGPGITDELTFSVTEWTSEEPNDEFQFGEYCSEQCIGKAVRELAGCSRGWKAQNEGSGLLLGSSEEFWDLLTDVEREQMEGAGWANEGWGAGEWILQPEQNSEDESDDE